MNHRQAIRHRALQTGLTRCLVSIAERPATAQPASPLEQLMGRMERPGTRTREVALQLPKPARR